MMRENITQDEGEIIAKMRENSLLKMRENSLPR